MRLTVLGCSGSVGGPGAACSGYLLQLPGQQPVLMDCGPGAFGELQRIVNPREVAVALSHLHADHCMDLAAMLVWRRYAPEPATCRTPLWGPPGCRERIGAGSSEVPGELDDITDTFDVHEWGDGEVELGGFVIRPVVVDHVPNSYGFRVTAPGGTVVAYSGDTAPCDELIELAADADLFLCEASWTHAPSERPPHLHLSGIEAGEAATKANAKLLAITHIPPWTAKQDIYDEVRQTYSGRIEMVSQGQVFDL